MPSSVLITIYMEKAVTIEKKVKNEIKGCVRRALYAFIIDHQYMWDKLSSSKSCDQPHILEAKQYHSAIMSEARKTIKMIKKGELL